MMVLSSANSCNSYGTCVCLLFSQTTKIFLSGMRMMQQMSGSSNNKGFIVQPMLYQIKLTVLSKLVFSHDTGMLL